MLYVDRVGYNHPGEILLWHAISRSQGHAFALRAPLSSAAHMGTPLASRSSFASPVALRVTNDKEMDVAIQQISMSLASGQKPVVIGLAADSGCGKSTFMRRVTACFGGACKLNPIGRETNTLISDMTTVICLDDYHLNDRQGRKKTGSSSGL
eukprot:761654-Hanusia_phi.AAC.8